MHSFSKVITAATGLLAFGSVASAWEDYKEGTAKDSCAGPEITTYHGIGGGGGGQFDACKFNEGIFPSKLEIWSDYEAVRGLVLTYSDGSHTEIGKKSGDSQKMEWNPSTDYINHLQLWDIGRGGDGWGISRISIGLNNNQKIDVGNDDSGYGADYTAAFEAGALFMGITGRVSDRIERLDFVTSKTAPKSFAVTDMALDPSVEEVNAMAAAARGIKPKSILVVYGVNSRKKGEMKIWSEKTETETVTTSITNTKSQTFGVSVGWSFEKSFGLPTVAQSKLSVSNEYKWEKTTSEAKMEGTTNTTSIRGLVDTTVAPQTAVRCESWYLEARQEQIRWTGKVKITFADNNFLAFDSLGDYSTTQVSETIHSCEEVDMDVLEKAIKDGEEVQSDGKSKDEILNDVEELKHNNQTATARARMARSAKLRF